MDVEQHQQNIPLSKNQLKKQRQLEFKRLKKEEKKRQVAERLKAQQEEALLAKEKQKGNDKALPIPEDLIIDGKCSGDQALPHVEVEHVQKVYDQIAPQWNGTRYKSWPKVADFISKLPKGSFIGDIGCGNGKNIPACNSVGFGIGCDFSAKLIEICNKRKFEVFVADGLHLPFRSNLFDAVISIAVLHHISTEKRRIRLISEAMRTVKPNGLGLFYAWAQEQNEEAVSGHRFEDQDVLVPWHIHEKDLKDGQNVQLDHVEKNEEKQAVVFQRYCHVYKKGELELLFNQIDGIEIKDSYYDCGNWCIIAQKI